jgi:hypothetical protein
VQCCELSTKEALCVCCMCIHMNKHVCLDSHPYFCHVMHELLVCSDLRCTHGSPTGCCNTAKSVAVLQPKPSCPSTPSLEAAIATFSCCPTEISPAASRSPFVKFTVYINYDQSFSIRYMCSYHPKQEPVVYAVAWPICRDRACLAITALIIWQMQHLEHTR